METFKQAPELLFEAEMGVLEFADATGACSEAFPFSVKELMAHLHTI